METTDYGSTGTTLERQHQEPILVVATGDYRASLTLIGRQLYQGFEALQDFAKRSQRNIILVLGCRTPAKPRVSATLNAINNIHKLDVFELDLASNESIRAFATHILDTYSQARSVLLLCGGAIGSRRTVDASGIERTLQINVLSQALLLQCLWARLIEPAVSHRVVFVASSLHKKAAQQHEVSPSSLDGLLDDKHWKSMSAYSISKLVQMHLFQIVADAFAEVQDEENRPVAIAVSPGFVPQTGLVREYYWWTRLFMTYVMPLFPFTTSLQDGKYRPQKILRMWIITLPLGGRAIAQGMIDQNLQSGTYISPRGTEALAQECSDTSLRSAWNNWLISKGVWKQP